MSNAKTVPFPQAFHDFAKGNSLPRSAFEVHPGGPSLTRQEFADECDINTIMGKYDAYLSDPMRSVREPLYYDFTQQPDTLIEAMEVLKAGETAFYSLPAIVRREFDNNAASFVDFASDPENLPQMRTWGLAKPEAKPLEPQLVKVVQDDPKPPSEPPAKP